MGRALNDELDPVDPRPNTGIRKGRSRSDGRITEDGDLGADRLGFQLVRLGLRGVLRLTLVGERFPSSSLSASISTCLAFLWS